METTLIPRVRGGETVRWMMLDVALALTPALLGAIRFFGLRALALALFSAAFCTALELISQRLLGAEPRFDGSAAITGLLLAMLSPVTLPYWYLAIGDAFAIVVCKQLFGGLGRNPLNPAAAAWAVLFTVPYTALVWALPGQLPAVFGQSQVLTAVPPLWYLRLGVLPDVPLRTLFLGGSAGAMGCTSPLLLAVGGLYLMLRRVVPPGIPLSFFGGAAAVALALAPPGQRWVFAASQLCVGILPLAGLFLAADPVTSPIDRRGRLAYGAAAGAGAMALRLFTALPDGAAYAILLLNLVVFLAARRISYHPIRAAKSLFPGLCRTGPPG